MRDQRFGRTPTAASTYVTVRLVWQGGGGRPTPALIHGVGDPITDIGDPVRGVPLEYWGAREAEQFETAVALSW